jgi:hypothetical protein
MIGVMPTFQASISNDVVGRVSYWGRSRPVGVLHPSQSLTGRPRYSRRASAADHGTVHGCGHERRLAVIRAGRLSSCWLLVLGGLEAGHVVLRVRRLVLATDAAEWAVDHWLVER